MFAGNGSAELRGNGVVDVLFNDCRGASRYAAQCIGLTLMWKMKRKFNTTGKKHSGI